MDLAVIWIQKAFHLDAGDNNVQLYSGKKPGTKSGHIAIARQEKLGVSGSGQSRTRSRVDGYLASVIVAVL